jgi:hypothetical protein
MIQMSVLGLETSHLLLIRTTLGYGTMLTVACTHQGSNATDYCCCCCYIIVFVIVVVAVIIIYS